MKGLINDCQGQHQLDNHCFLHVAVVTTELKVVAVYCNTLLDDLLIDLAICRLKTESYSYLRVILALYIL